MRTIPTFAEITAWLRAPLSDAARRRGRYVASAVAAGGAFVVLHAAGDAAHAATTKQQSAKNTPAATAVSTPAPATYTVRAGDTLSHIALRHKVSVDQLKRLNGLNNPNFIVAGRTLLIPTAAQTQAQTQTQAQPAPAAPATSTGAVSKQKIVGPKSFPTTGAYSATPTPGQAVPPKLASKPDRLALRPAFAKAAADYGVSRELLEAMCWNESGWQNNVVSSPGAMGIGQLMPATVDFVNESLVHGKLDPKKPEQNIRMSAAFLRYLLKQTGNDPRLALASYYQGLASVRNQGILPETDQYVRTVLALQRAYF
jgi:N-acetylmuramoyl-L-alanine amidase